MPVFPFFFFMKRNQTPVCEKGYLRISESLGDSKDMEDFSVPHHFPSRFSSSFSKQTEEPITSSNPQFGQFCGSMIERSVTFFSQSNNVSVTAVVPSRASIPSTSFGLYLTYR